MTTEKKISGIFLLIIIFIAKINILLADQIPVSSNQELMSALENASGGDVILLAPGNYGDLSISGYPNRTHYNYSDYVTITSQDSNNRAVFELVYVGYASHLRFDNIVLHHDKRPGEEDWAKAFYVVETDHFDLLNSELHGSVDNNYDNDVYGFFSYTGTKYLLVQNNFFHDWTRGTLITGEHVVVRGNTYSGMRSDGADFAEIVDGLVEENYFTDFHPCCGDHPDMIQFWNNNSDHIQRDVIIRNNRMFRGPGDWTQSIFIQSNNPGFPNENFLIEGNIIYNGHLHGISVSETNGLIIRHNTVLAFRKDPSELIASINVYDTCANALVQDNVSTAYSLAPSVISENNITAQNGTSQQQRSLPTHYDNLFVNANAGELAQTDDFYPLPTSILIQNPGLDIGALEYNSHPPDLTALILADKSSGSAPLTVQFDGSLSGGPNPVTSYHWDFGDNQTAEGPFVVHTFQNPNTYQVTLTVTDSSNQMDSAQKSIIVNPPPVVGLIYGLTFDGNILDFSDNHMPANWTGEASYVAGEYGQAMGMNGLPDESYVVVPYQEPLDGMSQFSVAFWARKNSPDTGGTALLKHISYWFKVNSNSLGGYFFNDQGARTDFNFVSNSIQDTDWHHYAITYDGAAIMAYLDGNSIGTTAMSGPIAVHQDRDLDVGRSPWENGFNGPIDELRLYNIALTAEQVADLALPSGSNHPPLVSAGQDTILHFPEVSLILSGTASDDGLPNPPGALTTQWSQINGPANVLFTDALSLSSSVQFPSAGIYLLRLTVNDGELFSTDDVQIIVEGLVSNSDTPTETRFQACQDPKVRGDIPICFDMAERGRVSLTVYTRSGREIRTLINEDKPAGSHKFMWDCKNNEGASITSGIYIVVLDVDGKKMRSKLAVIK